MLNDLVSNTAGLNNAGQWAANSDSIKIDKILTLLEAMQKNYSEIDRRLQVL